MLSAKLWVELVRVSRCKARWIRTYIGGGSPNRACVFKICVSESAVPIHHGLSHLTWALYGHEYSHADELWVMRGTHGVWGLVLHT